jgi:hypothetical protein
MMNQSFTSTKDSGKGNVQYSQSSLSVTEKHVRYSRHLSLQHKQKSSNGRPRLVIHTTVRSPKNKRRPTENKSAVSNSDLHSVRYFFF